MACCGQKKQDFSHIDQLLDHLETLHGLVPVEGFEQFKRLADAAVRWSGAGFPVCTQAEFDSRMAVCRSCSLWDDAARLGFGRCNHPDCGCTRAKHWLKTEFCPDSKW